MCCRTTKLMRHNWACPLEPWTAATEPTCHNCWSQEASEPVLGNKRSHHSEKLSHCHEEYTLLAWLEKAHTQSKKDPVQPKKKKKRKRIKVLGVPRWPSSQPACYRQPSRCWSQGYTWMWLIGPRISKGATYSVLTSCSRVFFPQNCTILAATGKTINKKIHLSTSLLLGWTNIFPWVSSGPWVSNSLIGKRSFPAFEILQLLQIWWKML